jgi:hypothetical protein
MNSYHRTLVLAAAIAIAISGVAGAEGTASSSLPQQTTSFLGWLWRGATPAPKPHPVANKLSAPVAAKPQPTCTLLPCVILVGIGF